MKLKVDGLLVPGDLTNKARREGLSQSWDYVLEVGRHLGTDIVLPVIGNHDVDSRKQNGGQDPFFNIRNLRPHFPFRDEDARRMFFSEGFCLLDVGEHAEVVAVNTVIDHTDEVTAKRGAFDIARIAMLKSYLTSRPRRPIRIGMMHHHPILHTAPFLTDSNVIATGDELLRVLHEGGCEFVVHGHRHVPRLAMSRKRGPSHSNSAPSCFVIV
jgi:predicted phosphodiesterase